MTGVLRAVLCLAFASAANFASAFQDNFASASTFNYPTVPQFTGFNNTGAGAETGELSHNLIRGLAANRSLWANFTVAQPGYVTLSTAGSNFDTLLSVYTGTSVKSLKRIAADDDINPGVNNLSAVTFLAKPGVIYRVAVDAKGAGGTGNVAVTGFTPLLARTWIGVLLDVSTEGSGLLTVNTTTTGAISGTLKQGTKTHAFTGVMSPTGRIVVYILRKTPEGVQPAILDVTQLAGATSLQGSIYADSEETNDNFSLFNVSLLPAGKYTSAFPCPRKGVYTFTTGAGAGMGFSTGSMSVSATGAVKATGFSGDGSAFTLAGPLLDTGTPNTGVFRGRQIVGGTGHVTANFFLNGAAIPISVSGDFFMLRGIKPGASFLPAGTGLAGGGAVVGAIYTPPAAGARMNSFFDPGGTAFFNGGSSAGGVPNQPVNLLPTNVFTYTPPNTSKLVLTPNKTSGSLTGSVTLNGVKCTIKGVSIFSATHKGFYGFVSGPAGNGTMTLFPTGSPQ